MVKLRLNISGTQRKRTNHIFKRHIVNWRVSKTPGLLLATCLLFRKYARSCPPVLLVAIEVASVKVVELILLQGIRSSPYIHVLNYAILVRPLDQLSDGEYLLAPFL
jgi:hypothetical protein